MRVRDKRRQQKEQKAQKASDKQKSTDAEAKPETSATAATTTATTQPQQQQQQQSQQPSTLPATEKVAFDNRIKRKNVLALNEKVAALREYDRQPVYKHVGRMFNCSPDQIKRIVQQKEEILRAWEQRTRRSQDAKTQELKVVRVSMLGKAVYDWIRRMMYYKDFTISDGLIQKMALQFKSSMGLNNFFPHQEWCDKFRITYNIQHNDTKLLKIGYTQSHSVQINDIAKDVMSECTPAADAAVVAADDDEEDISLATISGSSHADEDDADVDIDGGGDMSDEDESQDVKPSISELNQARVLQPLPQLMRLPQVPPGTSQKVLLATPILPPGAAAGGAQTMTIIPLATLAQSITQRPVPQTQPKAGMPPPMLDIKQEIKTEPKDADELEPTEEQKTQEETIKEKQAEEEEDEEEPPVRIKQELDSDNELLDDDDDDDANGGRSSVTSLAEILAANVDDEKQYIEQNRALRHRKRSRSPATDLATPMSILPPMPPLTKAPVAQSPPAKRQRQHDDNNNAGSGQSIISCAEARKYLKLLEEFALSKENYRLIGLITRADEVMRELADE
ncbi:uncharacterized protein LOC117788649 [Drosophila innubila]|uniref:uncharacterized protein LOC117788649 n=1 Tax=Drosophila innubila TaxID=198719 RepID=UPI00148BB94D|nr:uncharacterized protein LOC117788649 [Drosophila innubila]